MALRDGPFAVTDVVTLDGAPVSMGVTATDGDGSAAADVLIAAAAVVAAELLPGGVASRNANHPIRPSNAAPASVSATGSHGRRDLDDKGTNAEDIPVGEDELWGAGNVVG